MCNFRLYFIYTLFDFSQKSNNNINAVIDFSNKINIITLIYVLKLGF